MQSSWEKRHVVQTTVCEDHGPESLDDPPQGNDVHGLLLNPSLQRDKAARVDVDVHAKLHEHSNGFGMEWPEPEASTSAPTAYAALMLGGKEAHAASSANHSSQGSKGRRAVWQQGTSAAAAEGRRLAAQIRGCSNWYQLRALLSTNRASLNMLHATSALSHMARIATYPMQGQEASELGIFLDSLLLPVASRCMADMGPRELSTCCHALACLGHVPPATWLSQLIDVTRQLLPSFSPRDVSILTWALGSLKQQQQQGAQQQQGHHAYSSGSGSSCQGRALEVPGWLLQQLEAASLASMSRFNSQDMSTLALGLARLSYKPGPTWTEVFLDRAALLLHKCNPQVLSNILHSLDRMEVQPGLNWLSSLAAASLPLLPACSGQALATMAGAIGRMWQAHQAVDAAAQASADVAGRQQQQQRWHGSRMRFDSRQLHKGRGNLAAAGGAGGSTVLSDWVRQVLHEVQGRLARQREAYSLSSSSSYQKGLGPEDLVCLALCVPALSCILSGTSSRDVGSSESRHAAQPLLLLPSGCVQDLQAAIQQLLPSFSPMQLANALMAIARLHSTSGPMVTEPENSLQIETQLASTLPKTWTMTPEVDLQGSAAPEPSVAAQPPQQSAPALPPLGAPWLRLWLRCAARSASYFNASDTAQALWALATLHRTGQQLHGQQQQQPQQQQPVSRAWAQIPPEWIDHFLNSTRARLAEMSASQLSLSLWALSALGHKPGWQWSLAMFEASLKSMPAAMQQDADTCTAAPKSLPAAMQQDTDTCTAAPQATPASMRHGMEESHASGQGLHGVGVGSGSHNAVHAQDLSMLLLALGKLRLRPLQSWMSSLLDTLLPMLSSGALQGQALAQTLWGLYRLRLVLHGTALTVLLEGVSRQAQHMGREDATIAAWAVSRLWANARSAGTRGSSRAGMVQRRRRWLKLRQQQQKPVLHVASLQPQPAIAAAQVSANNGHPIRLTAAAMPELVVSAGSYAIRPRRTAVLGQMEVIPKRRPSLFSTCVVPAAATAAGQLRQQLPQEQQQQQQQAAGSQWKKLLLQVAPQPPRLQLPRAACEQRALLRRQQRRALRSCLRPLLMRSCSTEHPVASRQPDYTTNNSSISAASSLLSQQRQRSFSAGTTNRSSVSPAATAPSAQQQQEMSSAGMQPHQPCMLPPRSLAMAVSAWALPGSHVPPPPEPWLRLVLASVRLSAEATAARLAPQPSHLHGSHAAGLASQRWFDGATLLTTLAALRKLRSRRSQVAADRDSSTMAVGVSSTGIGNGIGSATGAKRNHKPSQSGPRLAQGGGADAWAACDAAWSLRVCQAAVTHVPHLQSYQVSALLLGVAALCAPAAAACAAAQQQIAGSGSDAGTEQEGHTWEQQQLVAAVDVLSVSAISRIQQLSEERQGILLQQQQQAGAAKPRRRKLQLPAALLPLHTAGVASALAALQARLPKPEASWLLHQLKGAMVHLPQQGARRWQAEAAAGFLRQCCEQQG